MGATLAIAAAAVVLILLQTTFVPMIPVLPVVPDLLVVLTVWVGVRHHGVAGVCAAAALGYLTDVYSGTTLGMHVFAHTATYVASYVLARALWTESVMSASVVTFFAVLVHDAALGAAAVFTGEPTPYWRHLVQFMLVDGIIAALVAPILFTLMRWERRMFARVAA